MSYMGTHNKVRRVRGKASEHACPCGERAETWAFRNGCPDEEVDDKGRRYSRNTGDYDAMCWPCHNRYDKSLITHCPHGHEYTIENTRLESGKRKCRLCVYLRNKERRLRVPMTPEQHAHKMAMQRMRRAQAKLKRLDEQAAA